MTTRESPAFALLSYEARALYWMMQPLLDERGAIACGERPSEYLALVLRAPVEMTKSPLEELCRNGVFDNVGGTYFDMSFASRNGTLDVPVEMTEPLKKKKKKKNEDKDSGEKRAGRPPKDARHRPVMDAWWRQHEVFRQEKPLSDPAGAKNVSRLLSKLPPEVTVEDIEQRMKVAFADAWFKANGNLSLFCSRWNNYKPGLSLAGVSPQATVRKIMVDFDAETNERIFADGTREVAR